MRQITGRMTGTEIELEMEIQSLRVRLAALEETVRGLHQRLSGLEHLLDGDPSVPRR